MTPKEKAEELFDIYRKQVSMTIKDNSLIVKVLDNDIAKQCALIAVDEILNEYDLNICYRGYEYDFQRWDCQKYYWLQVKEQIEIL